MFTRRKKESFLKKFKSIRLSKRQEFVVITAFLTFLLITTQLSTSSLRFVLLFILALSSYFLSAWSLREDLKKVEWFTLLSLPTMFTISLGIFYFLLPVRWLTRVPVAVLYAVGMYAILLVENIYNVAVNRSIQLLRVAHAVGFLLSMVTLFLLLNTVFSFRLHSYWNFILTFIISFPITLQSLWSTKLTEDRIEKEVYLYGFFVSFVISQLAFIISFWPLKPILASLFLSSVFYTVSGVVQQYFAKKLFRKNIIEYVQVFFLISILIFLTASYR